jgi:acyl dehydratase
MAMGGLYYEELTVGMSFPKPVYPGDTLSTKTLVHEMRESRSRPDAGIVVFVHRCRNQRGEEVAVCKRTALMKSRKAA